MSLKSAFGAACLLAVSLSTGGCVTTASAPEPVPEIRPGILQGYLDRDQAPNSLNLVPPPPAEGSKAVALDQAINARLLTLQNSPRFALATEDNELRFPEAAATFACAIDAPITETDTPFLYQLLRRSLADAGLATYGAKLHYERKRPFLINGAPICVSDHDREELTDDPSYPSGHTSIGWAWALILAEVAPDRAGEILSRGLAFGDSRAICNVHWPSDVTAGRTIGAATVAALHANETFRRDIEAAKKEFASVRTAGLAPGKDCAAEAAALTATGMLMHE